MKKRCIENLYILFVIFLGGFVFFCGSFFLKEKDIDKKINDQVIDNLSFQYEDVIDDLSLKYKNLRLEYNNSDVIGTLKIDNLFETIVVQGDDNSYYLNHLINKGESILGAVFLDYRSDLLGNQLNFYGHNSKKYDVPFKQLIAYLSYDFYLNNKYITFETEFGISTYEIFSVKAVTDDEHTKVVFDNTSEYKSHLEILRSDSLYDTNVNVSESDNILVLQTCLFDNSLGNYLIINSKKI